jgi:iron complex transport system ATP-binding protein
MTMLETKNLTVSYGSLTILDNLSIDVRPQQWLMVVGPNGAGKSTLVSAVAQGVPYSGKVLIDGQDVRRMKPKAAARRFGVLTQSHAVGYAFTVEEIVRLGRYAFSRGMFSGKSEEDERRIGEALKLTGWSRFGSSRP